MFSNPIRLTLIFVSILAAVLMFYSSNFYYGALFVISATLFTYGYFRYGSVKKAFEYLKIGKNEKAAKTLDSIKFPNLLSKQQSGFYYFTKAVLEQDEGNLDGAEMFYLKALEQGVRTSNNEAIINLNLGKIYLEKNLQTKAGERLLRARDLSSKEELTKEINELIPQIET